VSSGKENTPENRGGGNQAGNPVHPNWRMRKLDLATIGLLREIIHFLGGGVCSGIGVLPVVWVAKARLCPAQGLSVRAGAMGMHGPPFTRRRALPPVKRAKKRVRIFVAEKISGFIQLQRGMQQIMLREFKSWSLGSFENRSVT
jgi:hypothetical protein